MSSVWCCQGSHVEVGTSDWWQEVALCASLEEVMFKGWESMDTCYFGRVTSSGSKRYLRLNWKDLDEPPYSHLWSYLDMPVTAFTEVDEKWWSWQPDAMITYHAFVILEVENAGWWGESLFILLERCHNNVQFLFGSGDEVHLFLQQYYANGQPRNVKQCLAQPRRVLDKVVTLRHVLEWLDNVVAREWQPYNLLAENCQHFAADLQQFLISPKLAWRSRGRPVDTKLKASGRKASITLEEYDNEGALGTRQSGRMLSRFGSFAERKRS